MEYLAAIGGPLEELKDFRPKLGMSKYWNWFEVIELPDEDYFVCYFHEVNHIETSVWESNWEQISLLVEESNLSWKTISIGNDEVDIEVASFEGDDGGDLQLHELFYVKRTIGFYDFEKNNSQ